MTPQTPPTDRPLTAGDVPLLREGDVLQPLDGRRGFSFADRNRVVFLRPDELDPQCIYLVGFGPCSLERFAFVSRPATSAASEGEGVVAPFAEGGVGHAMQERGYAYLKDYVLSTDGADYEPNEFERSLLEDFMSGLLCDEAMFGPVRALLTQQAALASLPVSERERELEGALRYVVGLLPGLAGAQHQPDNAVYTVMAAKSEIMEARRLRDTLTAQPAGEGK